MREIKFKVVWNGEVSNEAFTIGEFVEGVEMSFKDGGTLPFKDIDWSTDKVEYLQYTGLKDKNGKEIFEGDVVQVFYDGHPQEPGHEAYTVVIEDMVKSQFGGVGNGQGEVIGNIYENSELLK